MPVTATADGGLLGDVLARGGKRIIANSILLSLDLSDALLAIEQDQFLASLRTGSFIGYGSGAFLDGRPDGLPPVAVSEPAITPLLIAMLMVLIAPFAARRMRTTAQHRAAWNASRVAQLSA